MEGCQLVNIEKEKARTNAVDTPAERGVRSQQFSLSGFLHANVSEMLKMCCVAGMRREHRS